MMKNKKKIRNSNWLNIPDSILTKGESGSTKKNCLTAPNLLV